MKAVLLASLAVIAFWPGITVAQTDMGPESPDRVALYDFTQDSAVWGRKAQLDLPAELTANDIIADCRIENVDLRSPVCLEPYIISAEWFEPPINPSGTNSLIIDDVDPGTSHCSSTSLQVHVYAHYQDAYDDYQMFDPVDPEGSFAGDPFRHIEYTDWCNEFIRMPRKNCNEWDQTHGECHITWFDVRLAAVPRNNPPTLWDAVPPVGVEMWDDDTGGGGANDKLDISAV